MAIYRYRKIDENNLVAWANDQLWFSSINELDDGFEWWCILDSQGFGAESKELQNLVTGYLHEYKEGLLKKSALCCFSSEANLILMWAVYGDGLRGVCVEYDENMLMLNGKPIDAEKDIRSVDYPPDTTLPRVDIHGCHANQCFDGIEKKLIATKSMNWKEQEEVRVIWRQDQEIDKGILIKINREAVKSIIFGERADPDKVKLVKDIFGKSMTYKVAKRSTTHYKIDIELLGSE